jgi:hypothetical protein
MSVPEKIWLFRIVHWQNLEYILQHGMMTRSHPDADPNYVEIGHRQLISDRSTHTVRVEGVDGPDGELILGDCVPFYFGPHSPMLYMIMNGFSGVPQKPQRDIVYVISSFDKVSELGLEYAFSDQHAKTALARFFNTRDRLDEVDWETVFSQDWRNRVGDQSRRDRKQAEFLVKSIVPVEAIQIIGVATEARQTHAQALVDKFGLDIKVHLDKARKLYY